MKSKILEAMDDAIENCYQFDSSIDTLRNLQETLDVFSKNLLDYFAAKEMALLVSSPKKSVEKGKDPFRGSSNRRSARQASGKFVGCTPNATLVQRKRSRRVYTQASTLQTTGGILQALLPQPPHQHPCHPQGRRQVRGSILARDVRNVLR